MKVINGYVLAGFLALSGLALIGSATVASTKAADKEKIVLSASNTLVLNDIVEGDSVSSVLEKAKELDSKHATGWGEKVHNLMGSSEKKPLYLWLNTPGGSVQAGLELTEALNGLHRPVHTVTAFAASMGFQIAQSLGSRYIIKDGILMSHRATGAFEGAFGGQEPSQAANRYRIWTQRLKEMDEQTVRRTEGKQTLESYQKAYDNELWVTGAEAVAQGYADKVVQVSCDSSLDGVTTHTVLFMGVIPVDYDVDNCPINSSPHNIRLGMLTNKGKMSLNEFKAKNGGFGSVCLQEAVIDDTRVCSLDTTLSYEKIEQIKSQFVNSFENKRSHVIPMQIF